jgi:Putative zinc-finger
MTTCLRQASGEVELYFYDELDPSTRASVEQHLLSCSECRRALEELSTIRAALATRPVVDAPVDGDWSAFTIRLNETIALESSAKRVAADPPPVEYRALRYAPYLATAAVLTLVTSTIVYVSRTTARPEPVPPTPVAEHVERPVATPTAAPAVRENPEAGFAALSEQHFERSKLVVLGLANKDPRRATNEDWAYERGLASGLLDDTRLYRMAAEERGMKNLASVMGDLELVLLQTSLAEKPDPDTLERIQRLIHKRDLVTKMDAVATTGS